MTDRKEYKRKNAGKIKEYHKKRSQDTKSENSRRIWLNK